MKLKVLQPIVRQDETVPEYGPGDIIYVDDRAKVKALIDSGLAESAEASAPVAPKAKSLPKATDVKAGGIRKASKKPG